MENGFISLREIRQQSKKTIAEIAKVLNVTARAVLNYEQGIRRIGLEEILALSKVFDCTAEEIILAQLKSIEINKSK